ncbi:MAG: putative membrane protein YedE/YeeE [Bradymonadia bacterium]|jgi:uncharacterized membrane protein YedE/YeeE
MSELQTSILLALIGGVLIGVASLTMLLLNGRIAGISGIVGTTLGWPKGDLDWRLAFIVGLVLSGTVAALLWPGAFPTSLPRSLPAIAVAGVFVGVGTRMGSGCTSGHGVCGIGRLSPRSILATLTFMATGAATVALVRFGLGGSI